MRRAEEVWIRVLALGCLTCLVALWAWPTADRGESLGLRSTLVEPEVEEKTDHQAVPVGSTLRRGQETVPEARALPLEPAPTASSPPQRGGAGRLAGRVVDDRGEGVPGARVLLRLGSDRLETESDEAGAFVFERLLRGHYRLFVDGRSLPEGHLAPWRQTICKPYGGQPTGLYGTSFALLQGEERSVDLLVSRGAEVRGSLVGPGGEGVVGAVVTLVGVRGPRHTTRSDGAGRFRLEGLYPGRYSLQVQAGAATGVEPGSLPLPRSFDIVAGDRRELGPFLFEGGGHRILGRVLDEAGAAVVGLTLTCEEASEGGPALSWKATTDAQGRFVFGRLPEIPVSLRFPLPGDPLPTGAPRLAAVPSSTPVELEGRGALVDLGDLVVRRDRGYRYSARIEVDPEWIRTRRLRPFTLEWTESPDGLVHALDTRRPQIEWSCEVPHGPQRLELVFRSRHGEVRSRELELLPLEGQHERVVVRLP